MTTAGKSRRQTNPSRAVVYRWHYDNTGYYAYILLDGDERIRDVVCRRLRARGIDVIMSGASRRPADDGKVYDFYVRVARAGSEETDHPEPAAVSGVFERLPQFAPGPPAPPERPTGALVRPTENRGTAAGEAARLRSELAEEREKRLAALGRVRELREKLHRARRDVNDARSRYDERLDELRSRFEEERASLAQRVQAREATKGQRETAEAGSDVAPRGREQKRLEEEISGLREQLEALQGEMRAQDGDVDELYAAWGEAERSLETAAAYSLDLENRLMLLEHEKENLVWQVAKSRDRSVPDTGSSFPKASSKDTEALYAKVLGLMAPSLSLERGSIAVVATEFRENDDAIFNLRLLDAEPEKVRSERVEKAKEWREVKFQTGEDGNTGRIYYRRPRKGRGACRVLIGHKKGQERDIEWLRRHA